MQQWEEKRISSGNESDIVWYEIGTGPELLFLHGNWDHILYMPMLAEQKHNFRTLLLKQRGSDCWKSPGDYNTLPLRLFLEDIEHLRVYKGGGKFTIVGHSWGATLGLHYACTYPDNVRRLVLIGLGPLSDEMSQYYRANVRKMVHPDKLDRFDEVKRMFQNEFASGRGVSQETDEEYADVYSTVWAYSPGKADEIKTQYLNAGGFRRVAAGAPRGNPQELLNGIEKINCPVLIIYGYQDYEPITQAYMLKERIKDASISFINRCGHFVWIDQPDEFYRILNGFING
jgi:proline iminopeptidase